MRWWIAALIVVVAALAVYAFSFMVAEEDDVMECDAGAYDFYRISGPGNHDVLIEEYVGNISQLAEVCNVATFGQLADHRLFLRYGISSEDSGVWCDAANTTATFYFINDSLYSLVIGMGPCGSDNVRIH